MREPAAAALWVIVYWVTGVLLVMLTTVPLPPDARACNWLPIAAKPVWQWLLSVALPEVGVKVNISPELQPFTITEKLLTGAEKLSVMLCPEAEPKCHA